MFRTEKQYKEACSELQRQVDEGIIPIHSHADACFCIIKSMWESEWWRQKRINEIRRIN